MCKNIASAFQLLNDEFMSAKMSSLLNDFMKKVDHCSKWTLFSDYCLDDKTKPNDVVTFVLLPFLSEEQYKEMDVKIQNTQPADIKKVKNVSADYLEYIKSQAWFSFSFILNNRKTLFGDNQTDRINCVKQILNQIKQTILIWKNNSTGIEPIEYYDEVIKKLDLELNRLSPNSNIKKLMDILLVTLLGSYYSAMILKRFPHLEIFGWFPDRDSINEACNKIAFQIFHVLLYSHLGGRQFQYTSSVPDNTIIPFYDNFNRIADVICGTLADYNMKSDVVSKDKFSAVLKGLVADNDFIRIYRLSVIDDETHLGCISIATQPIEGAS